MSIFDDAATDILEGLTDAIRVTYQPKNGVPFEVTVRWLAPFVEIDAEGRSVMAKDVHAVGPMSALSDVRQGDTLLKGVEVWEVIRPKDNGAFMNLQVARVASAPSNGSP